jgi:hypothetical protein
MSEQTEATREQLIDLLRAVRANPATGYVTCEQASAALAAGQTWTEAVRM